MSEKRILLASLLKPVNDTRLYEKLGLSLSKLPDTTIHVCGYPAAIPDNAPGNVRFHPFNRFERLSPGRAKAQLAYYRLLVQVKPHLIILSTHELLAVSLAYKIRYGCRLIYDVQENYSLNLRAQQNYPWLLKHVMALTLRTVEHLTAPAIDHFLLAERSYAQELPFIKDRYTFIENKYLQGRPLETHAIPVAIPTNGPVRLLYSGTIAEEYGIWEAIRFAEGCREANPAVRLTIMGYCANAYTLVKLRKELLKRPYIKLIGGRQMMPHAQLLQEVRNSHIGLLPYRPNESTFRCIPTKLYEYMANGLPILIQQNPLWQTLVDGSEAGFSIDFSTVNASQLYQQLQQLTFYNKGIPGSIYWDSEEEKLLHLVRDVLQRTR